MRKLIINGIEADILESQKIALTKKLYDWEKLDSHYSNYSNTIVLPFTKKNNQIFESAYDTPSNSVIMRDFFNVVYIQDFVEIISNGKGKLLSVDEKGYSFSIYWGNIDLKAALEGKSIRKLNLNDLNHVWNLDNVLDWFISFPDVCYPVCDLSAIGFDLLDEGTINFPIKAYQLIPFVNVDRIISQIATDNGLVFNFQKANQFIPVATKKINPLSDFDLSIVDKINVLADTYTGNEVNYYRDFFLYFDKINDDDNNFFNIVDNQTTGAIFKNNLLTATTFVFDLNVFFEIITNQNDYKVLDKIKITFQKYDGTNWINDVIKEFETFEEIFTIPTKQIELIQIGYEVNLQPNEKIRAKLELRFFSYSNAEIVINLIQKNNIRTTTGDLSFGMMWKIAGNLPDISQFDFLKEICFLRGFVFHNSKENIFEFTKIDDILNAEVQDYSDKFISLEIENYHPEFAQKNVLKYNNDSTVVADSGSYIFDIENKTLKSKDTFFESKFSFSEMRAWNNTSVLRLPILNPNESNWVSINSRIATFEDILDLFFTDGITTQQSIGWKNIAKTNNLSMRNVWNKNYSGLNDVFNNFQRVRVLANLSQNDFYSIDLKRPIFFKQAGKFIIEEIKDFIPNEPTELILIKI